MARRSPAPHREVDIDQVKAPVDDFAALVQPREQRPLLGVSLLNPAEQGNGGALDIAPPVVSRSRCLQWS